MPIPLIPIAIGGAALLALKKAPTPTPPVAESVALPTKSTNPGGSMQVLESAIAQSRAAAASVPNVPIPAKETPKLVTQADVMSYLKANTDKAIASAPVSPPSSAGVAKPPSGLTSQTAVMNYLKANTDNAIATAYVAPPIAASAPTGPYGQGVITTSTQNKANVAAIQSTISGLLKGTAFEQVALDAVSGLNTFVEQLSISAAQEAAINDAVYVAIDSRIKSLKDSQKTIMGVSGYNPITGVYSTSIRTATPEVDEDIKRLEAFRDAGPEVWHAPDEVMQAAILATIDSSVDSYAQSNVINPAKVGLTGQAGLLVKGENAVLQAGIATCKAVAAAVGTKVMAAGVANPYLLVAGAAITVVGPVGCEKEAQNVYNGYKVVKGLLQGHWDKKSAKAYAIGTIKSMDGQDLVVAVVSRADKIVFTVAGKVAGEKFKEYTAEAKHYLQQKYQDYINQNAKKIKDWAYQKVGSKIAAAKDWVGDELSSVGNELKATMAKYGKVAEKYTIGAAASGAKKVGSTVRGWF